MTGKKKWLLGKYGPAQMRVPHQIATNSQCMHMNNNVDKSCTQCEQQTPKLNLHTHFSWLLSFNRSAQHRIGIRTQKSRDENNGVEKEKVYSSLRSMEFESGMFTCGTVKVNQCLLCLLSADCFVQRLLFFDESWYPMLLALRLCRTSLKK